MSSWFRQLFHPRPTRAELLNEGLGLAMNWGENWFSPVNGRLRERHPHLSAGELDQLDVTCQSAMRFAYDTAYSLFP